MKYFCMEQKDNKAILDIFGDIVSQEWDEGDVSANGISQQVNSLDDSITEIDVRINSYGGAVDQSLTIYNLLKNQERTINTYCYGFACSAASVIFLAGKNRTMYDSTLLMIHNPYTRTSGDAEKLRKVADDLEEVNAAIRSVYLENSNLNEQTLKDYMDNEKWINAQLAFEIGFATEIKKQADINTYAANARNTVFNALMRKEKKPTAEDFKEPENPAIEEKTNILLKLFEK